MISDITDALRYARTFYHRAFLAFASTLYAITLLLGPVLEQYKYCCGKLPHNIILPENYKWVIASIFFADAALLWWRIVDKNPKVKIATVVNIFTAVLWITMTLTGIFVYDIPWSANVGEIMVSLTALFVVTRTDYNIVDKGTA